MSDYLMHEPSEISAFRLAKILSFVAMIEAMVIAALGCTIASIMPLKQAYPVLVEVKSQTHQVVKMTPLEISKAARHTLVEYLLRQYVLQRETIDGHSEAARFKAIALMSKDHVFHDFHERMKTDNPQSPIRQFAQKNLERQIEIKHSAHLGDDLGEVYTVHFRAKDVNRHSGEVLQSQDFVVTITATLEAKAVQYDEQYINPVGLQVSHY